MDVEKCINCGNCKANCEFLKKYDVDLSELIDKKPDLCYECLLCGECSSKCPVGIDGRKLVLEFREKRHSEGRLEKKHYLSVLLEKRNYLFKNYSEGKRETVLFPGCNFPSFFPKATIKLIDLLQDELNAGVVFDCCGKPIAELGMKKEGERIVREINKRLIAMGVRQLVTVCPNCYYFLKDKLSVEVVDIYSKLFELGIKNKSIKGSYNVFIPCPDRSNMELLNNISKLLGKDASLNLIQDIQCCGLGGLAACRDKTIPQKLMDKLKKKDLDSVHTYCATCYGSFYRSGIKEPRHFLIDILNYSEAFPEGTASVLNRVRFKVKHF